MHRQTQPGPARRAVTAVRLLLLGLAAGLAWIGCADSGLTQVPAAAEAPADESTPAKEGCLALDLGRSLSLPRPRLCYESSSDLCSLHAVEGGVAQVDRRQCENAGVADPPRDLAEGCVPLDNRRGYLCYEEVPDLCYVGGDGYAVAPRHHCELAEERGWK